MNYRNTRVNRQKIAEIKELLMLSSMGPMVAEIMERRFSGASRAKVEKLVKRKNAACTYCGSTEFLTVDHIIPKVKGGTNEYNNLQILCKRCNTIKGSKSDAEARKILLAGKGAFG